MLEELDRDGGGVRPVAVLQRALAEPIEAEHLLVVSSGDAAGRAQRYPDDPLRLQLGLAHAGGLRESLEEVGGAALLVAVEEVVQAVVLHEHVVLGLQLLRHVGQGRRTVRARYAPQAQVGQHLREEGRVHVEEDAVVLVALVAGVEVAREHAREERSLSAAQHSAGRAHRLAAHIQLHDVVHAVGDGEDPLLHIFQHGLLLLQPLLRRGHVGKRLRGALAVLRDPRAHGSSKVLEAGVLQQLGAGLALPLGDCLA
mmetsp:Transcript_55033/g.144732  ORF Transcript_55033/g.144732 Transcript_55033/m.144732 type:complete len:256 (-) Transcript_55033:154-921(-)